MRVLKKVSGAMAVWLSLVLGQPWLAQAELSAPGEALVKMEFIERFTRFIEWPPDVLSDRHPLFIVCIAGYGAIADNLPQTAAYERFKNKPLAFRRVRVGDEMGMCHLLFVAASEESHLSELLVTTVARPVLTIADIPGAASHGSIISFYREGDRVLFEINRGLGDKSSLKISSRLLRLARLTVESK